MENSGPVTIAQLLYPSVDAVDFARIVSELERGLTRLKADQVIISWDNDDVVTFDLPSTRILLALTESPDRAIFACLTVSVGPNPRAASRNTGGFDTLCSHLVERIQARFLPISILWQTRADQADLSAVEALAILVPGIQPALPTSESIVEQVLRTDRNKALDLPAAATLNATIAHLKRPVRSVSPVLVAVNDHPTLPKLRQTDSPHLTLVAAGGGAEMAGVTAPYSTQMRLAAHCFNATLIVVWAPLGAAVMTYSLLRGEDMRLSSRLMAVAGTAFALVHSPYGQSIAAMAGVN